MKDFTLTTYKRLLTAFSAKNFNFLTFSEYLGGSLSNKQGSRISPLIILRHDVDARPDFALEFARIQHKLNIKGSYYFRTIQKCFNPSIITSIASLGHEIGYHYEDLSLVARNEKKFLIHEFHPENIETLVDKAINSFERNLKMLRELVPVKTICMHGSPLSKWDNRLLWEYYNYRDYGIQGEPYFDIDFNKFLYLTDTGRRWNGDRMNIRDKSKVNLSGEIQELGESKRDYRFSSTKDIIRSLKDNCLPQNIMMTFHPQRWSDRILIWTSELIGQNIKNIAKYFLIKVREQ